MEQSSPQNNNLQGSPQNDLLGMLRANWFILIFFGSLVASWSIYTQKIGELEKTVAVIQSSQEATVANFNTLSLQMARIETELSTLNRHLSSQNQ